MTISPAAQRVVTYLDGIIETNLRYILSGDYNPVEYRSACKINTALTKVRAQVTEEFAKEDEE